MKPVQQVCILVTEKCLDHLKQTPLLLLGLPRMVLVVVQQLLLSRGLMNLKSGRVPSATGMLEACHSQI